MSQQTCCAQPSIPTHWLLRFCSQQRTERRGGESGTWSFLFLPMGVSASLQTVAAQPSAAIWCLETRWKQLSGDSSRSGKVHLCPEGGAAEALHVDREQVQNTQQDRHRPCATSGTRNQVRTLTQSLGVDHVCTHMCLERVIPTLVHSSPLIPHLSLEHVWKIANLQRRKGVLDHSFESLASSQFAPLLCGL